jgi:primary-amine oxidase
MAPDPKKKAMKPYVVKEIRDTGPLFKFYQRVRRGEALVLWGVIGAANYNYIVEYGFRDDGTITCRLGASGQNFGGHYTVAHMHNGCWRIDMDLVEEGAMNNANSVKVIKHLEPVPNPVNAKETARVIEIDFNNGLEGGMEWNPREFSHLRVVANGLNNKHGHPVGYDLLPYIRSGTPRHFGKAEEFTRYDFWVTPFDMKEQYYVQLPKYCSRQPKRNILGTDVVIWYMSPMHHIPRDEDGIFPMEKGRPVRQGVTLTMWGGFDLRPRNVFEATPLY